MQDKNQHTNTDPTKLTMLDLFKDILINTDADRERYRNIFLSLLYVKYINDLNKSTESNKRQIIIPKEAKWEFIRKGVKDDDLEVVTKALQALEKNNTGLDGVFSRLNLTTHQNSFSSSFAKMIVENISKLNIPLNDFGNYFDSFLYEQSKDDRKSSGVFFQPKELSELMRFFIPENDKLSVYNPFSGYASLSIGLPENSSYFGQESNPETWAMSKLRMLAYQSPSNYIVKNEDSFLSWQEESTETFDFITFNPPYNVKINSSKYSGLNKTKYYSGNNANAVIIDQCFKMLNDGGSMVFIIPDGFLFSQYSKDVALKKYLVENGYLKKIIALPDRLLGFTSIPINLVMLSKSKNGENSIEFIDAGNCIKKENIKLQTLHLELVLKRINQSDQEHKRKISSKEIKENNFVLSVNRYVFEPLILSDEEKKSLVQLGELIIPIERNSAYELKGKMVRIRDLSDDIFDNSKSFEKLDSIKLPRYASLLENDTLLLATVWKSLKPTSYRKENSNIYYDSNSMFACYVNENKILKEYLLVELQKDYIVKQLDSIRVGGTSISRIRKIDLLKIFIVVPDIEEQHKKVFSYKNSIIEEQQQQVNELIESYGIDVADENSFLRHRISGTLNNLKGSFSKLKEIIEVQIVPRLPEIYQYKFNEYLNSTFLDYLNRSERDINYIKQTVNALGLSLSLDEIELKPISLLNFMKNYVEEIKERPLKEFDINLEIDEEALVEKKIKEIIIKGDKKYLYQVFDNIIENAVKHAFINTSPNHKIEIALLYDFEYLEVQIDFSNNGNPLPENFDFEAYARKGSKTGKHAGNGLGGWFINEVMKRHQGKLGITDETGPEGIEGEMVSSIELTFPIELKS